MFLSLFFCIASARPCIYTLSLHDALPICPAMIFRKKHLISLFIIVIVAYFLAAFQLPYYKYKPGADRKSTRLNSSHVAISYAVFCLKKKIKRMCVNSCAVLVSFTFMRVSV